MPHFCHLLQTRRSHVVGLVLSLCLGAMARPAMAWNAFGHKVVAEIAWQQLDDTTRQKIVDLLRRHPQFADDFVKKMPDDVEGADKATQDHWVFLQAATWPDIIRKKQYDEPHWHYIGLPVLPDGPRPSTANLSMEYPAPTKLDDYNVAQATKYCLSVLADDRAGVDAQAMAYCWVLHLIGDMHQPLHAADLVCNYFPVSDEGGNKITVVQGKNLHSLWDNLLGRQSKMSDVAREVAKLKEQPELWQVDTKLDINGWITESHDVATSSAYSPAILQAIHDTKPGEKMEPISLDEDYLKRAGQIARQRVVAAGLRLANLLRQLSNQ
jgi:hypothetical protein